jgi:hypothetical protein
MGTGSEDGTGVGEGRKSRGGGSLHRRVAVACLLVLCLALVMIAPASASTSYVDGISDQHFGSWAGNFSEAAGFNAPFPAFFASAWVGSPPSHIKLSRYVVQWDVMRGVGYSEEFSHLQQWYNHTIELGLTPDLALANYGCSGCVPPETSEYISRELAALKSGFPSINIYEAWNEPNLPGSFYVSAIAAAHYFNSAYSYCAGHGCIVVAGDFSDSVASLVSYEGEYRSALNPSDPGKWGIHPYANTKYEAGSNAVQEFKNHLPNPAGDEIWFTEVGAYYCEFGENRGARLQEENAKYLVNHLIPTFTPAHVFYYQAAWPWDEKPSCSSGTLDTGLYAAESTGGPVHARSAANIIFGPEGAPTATTGGPSGVQEAQGTVSGTVNPQGIYDAKYYFRYGTSTSYGYTTSLSDVGPGLNPVSENVTINGLQPETVYHYRLIATSAGGTSEGSDQTFKTTGGTSPSVAVVESSGYQVIDYVNSSGGISYWSYTPGTGWGNVNLGGSAAHGTSTDVALVPASGYQVVYYVNSSGGISYWNYIPGNGWSNVTLGGHAAPGTSPSGYVSQSSAYQVVYYQDSGGGISYWSYAPATGWTNGSLGGHAAPGTSPDVAVVPSTGYQVIYYHDSGGGISLWSWSSGSGWSNASLGGQVTPYTSPSIAIAPSSGYQVAYYKNSSEGISYWNYFPGTGFSNGTL